MGRSFRLCVWLACENGMGQVDKEKVMERPSISALQRAAQAWCSPVASEVVMDERLATAFAYILDHEWSKANLGNATTGELLNELRARCEVNGTLNYKTTGGAE